MTTLEILGIAFGLSMDALAVAIAASVALHPLGARQVFRFAFHFGLFQAVMPVLGWLVGTTVASGISSWDHWLAFALLLCVGGKALYQAWARQGEQRLATDPTRGLSLVMLSVATSIDALAVGLSLAMLDVVIWYPSMLIGLTTASLTALGMVAGSRLGSRLGRRMEAIGGLVLIAIGVKIVVDHLVG
jgi:putative Mn2+ efflux pump MntP